MHVSAEHLWKYYGTKCSVRDLSFQLQEKTVLGFIGPNGAGKSTTMRMLCSILPPSRGRIFFDGKDISADPVAAKMQIGYLPENAPLYGSLRVNAFLRFCGSMRGLSGRRLSSALEKVRELCSLQEVWEEETEALSKGFRRRVCLAQAILHEPAFLVLDEPTDGLDPNQKKEIRALIRSMNCAVIVSTHILEEIDAVCDRVLTVCHGEKVFDGTVTEFHGLTPSGNPEDAFALLTAEMETK